MRCAKVRERLSRGGRAAGLTAHLESCAACARFARGLAAAEEGLARPRSGVEPDAGFAARVVAALPQAPDPLGWAALRLLPAALALALALAGWSVASTPAPWSLVGESPTDDLLVWVIGNEENGS